MWGSFCLLITVYFSLFIFTSIAAAQAPLPDIENGEDNTSAAPADNENAATEVGWKLERGAKEPTFFSGRKEYDTDGRKLAMTSFRFGRVIGTAKGVTWEYYFEIIPTAFAMKNEVKNPAYISDEDTPDERPTKRSATYGLGIEPVGLRFVFLPNRRLKPYAQAGAGFIFTRKPIPVPQSPNYNFIGDLGGGMMYSLRRRQTVSFGYRYFHISNMNIGEINPGYNASVFYVGFSRFYK
ncbi:MAG: acyloxyacyl hydrolase [Acidobacteriota bacterium]